MEIFCKDLKDQAIKIINYEKKKIIPLTNEEKQPYGNQKKCHICKKEFCTAKNMKKNLNGCKKFIVIIQGNIEERLIVFANYAIKYQNRFM